MFQELTMTDIFISPYGNDEWSGTLPEANKAGTDGPLKTLTKAQELLRRRKNASYKDPVPAYNSCAANTACTVWLREGRYELKQPIIFTPDDSAPITFAAYENESVSLSGGVEITGWTEIELDGKACWCTELPKVKAGEWNFTQLWVNDERASRPRLPKKDLYWMEDGFINGEKWGGKGSDRFIAKSGDFRNFKNLSDVEAVVLHFWIEERLPVESYDPASRMVISSRISHAPLSWSFDGTPAPYYIDNVFEAFDEPGQWYLHRPEGKLYYLPKTGQTIKNTRIYAPKINQLLKLEGIPEQGNYVERLSFERITFEHSGCPNPYALEVAGGGPPHENLPARSKPRVAAPQAAYHIPGAISANGARYCEFRNCTFKHLGWYALELNFGCKDINIAGNEIADTGAGGIKIGGGKFNDPHWQYTGSCRITDNHIHNGGRVYHCGTGIQIRHAGDNLVAHNHIHHYYYSAISVGWTWGYKQTLSHNNIIEFNMIHDIGQGLLSDMGGIYLLGVAPGTVVRNNVIHTVKSAHYGGWAIYPDEGSSHLIIENNICYNTNCSPFHQHYGRENIVRNNIFAFGNEAAFALSKAENCRALNVYNNIFYCKGKPVFTSGYGHNFSKRPDVLASDLNLFWDEDGRVNMVQEKTHTTARLDDTLTTLAQWQALGLDLHSIIADPGFADPANGDFSIPGDSPACKIGFKPIDISRVGPRKDLLIKNIE